MALVPSPIRSLRSISSSPEKSALPSTVRGVGADRFGFPSGATGESENAKPTVVHLGAETISFRNSLRFPVQALHHPGLCPSPIIREHRYSSLLSSPFQQRL